MTDEEAPIVSRTQPTRVEMSGNRSHIMWFRSEDVDVPEAGVPRSLPIYDAHHHGIIEITAIGNQPVVARLYASLTEKAKDIDIGSATKRTWRNVTSRFKGGPAQTGVMLDPKEKKTIQPGESWSILMDDELYALVAIKLTRIPVDKPKQDQIHRANISYRISQEPYPSEG